MLSEQKTQNSRRESVAKTADQIASHFSPNSVINLRARMESKTDWTNDEAPMGKSTIAEGNIEFQMENGEWDGYLADSEKKTDLEQEIKNVALFLEQNGFKVNIIK